MLSHTKFEKVDITVCQYVHITFVTDHTCLQQQLIKYERNDFVSPSKNCVEKKRQKKIKRNAIAKVYAFYTKEERSQWRHKRLRVELTTCIKFY